jgi:hypothetical protein
MPPALLQIGSYAFAHGWSQIVILLPMAFCIVGIMGTCHHIWLVGWDGVLVTFSCRTDLKPISVSWEAGITGVSHHTSCEKEFILVLLAKCFHQFFTKRNWNSISKFNVCYL